MSINVSGRVYVNLLECIMWFFQTRTNAPKTGPRSCRMSSWATDDTLHHGKTGIPPQQTKQTPPSRTTGPLILVPILPETVSISIDVAPGPKNHPLMPCGRSYLPLFLGDPFGDLRAKVKRESSGCKASGVVVFSRIPYKVGPRLR